MNGPRWSNFKQDLDAAWMEQGDGLRQRRAFSLNLKADANYESSLEGGRKKINIGNAVAGNAVAKAGSIAADWAVKPGCWKAAEDP
jgi:hypothetical protein